VNELIKMKQGKCAVTRTTIAEVDSDSDDDESINPSIILRELLLAFHHHRQNLVNVLK
jgi:hypothetical protein